MWGTADKAFRLFMAIVNAIEAKVDLILAAVGTGSALGQDFSGDGAVERGASKVFSAGLTDNTPSGGPIATALIDVTGAVVTLEKSSGVGFSTAGITQPAVFKQDGFYKVIPQFLDGEWAAGDAYALAVEGILATAGGDVYPVRPMVWSGVIHETGDLEANLGTLITDAGNGFTSVDGKQDTAQTDLDQLTDRPKSLTTAAKVDQDITSENEITSGTQHVSARDEVIQAQVRAKDLVSAAANYTIRFTVTRSGVTYDFGEDIVPKRSGLTALMLNSAPQVLENGDTVRAFITSDGADSATPDIEAEFYEVG